MKNRTLIVLAAIFCVQGCSFDSTFFPIDERPDDEPALHQEDISLVAADGRSIHHVLIKPQSSPKATIFVFHGSGSKISNWAKLLGPLIDDGFQVFFMEYRGFGNSEGTASHELVVLDAQRAFVYLVSREDVKDRPLLVMGQSYGAQLAINIAADYPEHVAALIIEGAFTSFRDIAIHSTPWMAKPFTWAFFLSPYTSTELIRDIPVPTLVIHSQDDEVVPFSMGQELFEQAGGQKELWSVRGKHTDALVDYPSEFVARVNSLAGFADN